MKPTRTRKKNLIVSYKNLTPELLELLKQTYPEGYKDYIQRFEKPNGETIFVVSIETEDTCYMVKMDVKVDSAMAADAELDKEMYGDEEESDLEFEGLDAVEKEDDPEHRETRLHHGNYEEELDPKAKLKKNVELSKELAEAFGDDDTDEYDDDYVDDDDEEDDIDEKDDMEDDFEPSLEDIMGIEDEMGNLILPEDAELADKHKDTKKATKKTAELAEPKKRGRKKKEE